jgi:hypothetical protein
MVNKLLQIQTDKDIYLLYNFYMLGISTYLYNDFANPTSIS